MRILIIEDSADIAANLYDYLAARGHVPDAAADGVTGLHLAVSNDYDAILLDLALPGLDGLEVCRKLREEAGRDTPILMLTARDTLEDKLQGFACGADDYLVKPFALKEVEARLMALHKRHSGRISHRTLKLGALVFDPQSMTVSYADQPVRLPPKCLRLLELLMANPNRVFGRDELETAVWGDTLENSDTLRSHINTLRRALEKAGAPPLIETVHGLGYRITENHAG